MIARFLESGGEDGVERIASHLQAAISTNVGVAGVLSFEKATAGGCAHGAAGVVLGEADSFRGHPVEVGGLDDFLAVATEISVAKVIGKDVDNVGTGSGNKRERGEQNEEVKVHEKEQSLNSSSHHAIQKAGEEGSLSKTRRMKQRRDP